MAHLPPAQSQVEINHANFYTHGAYSNNFSKGVDLDLMTVHERYPSTLQTCPLYSLLNSPSKALGIYCPMQPHQTVNILSSNCSIKKEVKYGNRTHAL